MADLDRSITFYQDVVGLELAQRVPERHAAFLWIGAPGRTMLGLWSLHSSPLRMRLHIAFAVALGDAAAAIERLRSRGVTPLDSGGGPLGQEPEVIAWMPAASVYFADPDGHSLEYIAMLDGPRHPEWGRLPLGDWRRRVAASGAA